jgi:hypothetical protein
MAHPWRVGGGGSGGVVSINWSLGIVVRGLRMTGRENRGAGGIFSRGLSAILSDLYGLSLTAA